MKRIIKNLINKIILIKYKLNELYNEHQEISAHIKSDEAALEDKLKELQKAKKQALTDIKIVESSLTEKIMQFNDFKNKTLLKRDSNISKSSRKVMINDILLSAALLMAVAFCLLSFDLSLPTIIIFIISIITEIKFIVKNNSQLNEVKKREKENAEKIIEAANDKLNIEKQKFLGNRTFEEFKNSVINKINANENRLKNNLIKVRKPKQNILCEISKIEAILHSLEDELTYYFEDQNNQTAIISSLSNEELQVLYESITNSAKRKNALHLNKKS